MNLECNFSCSNWCG